MGGFIIDVTERQKGASVPVDTPPTPSLQRRKMYHSLWTNRKWIHRRVDEVTLLSRDCMTVKSTFDLDISYLLTLLEAIPDKEWNGYQIALPLMVLPREPLLKIDVDLNGVPQSFAGSSTSADVARCILLQDIVNKSDLTSDNLIEAASTALYEWLLEGEVEKLYAQNKEWERQHTSRIEEIKSMTTKDQGETETAIRLEKESCEINSLSTIWPLLVSPAANRTSNYNPDSVGASNSKNISNSPTDTAQQHYEINKKLWEVYSQLTSSFIGVVLVDLPKNVQRGKLTIAITSRLGREKPVIGRIFPIRFAPIPVKIPSTLLGSGQEKRYHYRINAPDGHYISSLKLLDSRKESETIEIMKPGRIYSSDKEYCNNREINLRLATTSSRTYLEIQDKSYPNGGKNFIGADLQVGLEPFSRIFILRALLSVILLVIYLLIAKFMIYDSGGFPPFIGSILALLVTIPIWLRIGSEHDFTSATLRLGRQTLAYLAIYSLAIGFLTQIIAGRLNSNRKACCKQFSNENMHLIPEHDICESINKLFTEEYAKSKMISHMDAAWEVALIGCALYLVGIVWFGARVQIFSWLFSDLIKSVNNEPRSFYLREKENVITVDAADNKLSKFLHGHQYQRKMQE